MAYLVTCDQASFLSDRPDRPATRECSSVLPTQRDLWVVLRRLRAMPGVTAVQVWTAVELLSEPERDTPMNPEREVMLLTAANVPYRKVQVVLASIELPEVVLLGSRELPGGIAAYRWCPGVAYDVPGRTSTAVKHLPCYREVTCSVAEA